MIGPNNKYPVDNMSSSSLNMVESSNSLCEELKTMSMRPIKLRISFIEDDLLVMEFQNGWKMCLKVWMKIKKHGIW